MNSPETPTRILFVGDMHLGRSPGGVPGTALDLAGLSLRDLGPAAAWRRVVETAVNLGVDAVALAGDLVESDNARFEALGHLEDGVRKLAGAGIATVAVAGNHDTEALPRLADRIGGFTLLGRGGVWETVETGTGPVVRIAGWSFPTRTHHESPLANDPPPSVSGTTTFGLLHGDLDGAGNTPYAPVKSAELDSVGYQGWFMGHVHKPGEADGAGRPFYLGSLTGLDAAETGEHGPVLVEVDRSGRHAARRLPLAPLRWEHLDLDLTGRTGELRDLLEDAAHEAAREVREAHPDLRALGLRFHLAGEVDDPAAVDRAARAIGRGEIAMASGDCAVFIDKLTVRVAPRVDLAELARQDDPPGLLARRILLLEDPGTDATDLLARTRAELETARGREYFRGLGEDWTPDDVRLRRLLAATARRTLAAILAQRPDDREARHAAG